MKALIVVNGSLPSDQVLHELCQCHDLIVALDGATHGLLRIGETPDLICGEFDSIGFDEAAIAAPTAERVRLADQNKNDLEKTLALLEERGVESALLVGALGKRLDQSLTSVSVLSIAPRKIMVDLYENGSRGMFLNAGDTRAVPCSEGETVSLVVLDPPAVVTIEGVQWPLENERLDLGSRGVSNVASGGDVRLTVQSGKVVFVVPFRDNQ